MYVCKTSSWYMDICATKVDIFELDKQNVHLYMR